MALDFLNRTAGFNFEDLVFDFSGESLAILLLAGAAVFIKYFFTFYTVVLLTFLFIYTSVAKIRALIQHVTTVFDTVCIIGLLCLVNQIYLLGQLPNIGYLNPLDYNFTTENYILRPVMVDGFQFFNFSFRFDVYGSVFFLLSAIFINIVSTVTSSSTGDTATYMALFLIRVGSLGTFSSANLITFIIFSEISALGVFTFVLHGHHGNRIKSALIYIVYSFISGLCLICAVCILAEQKINLNFYQLQLVHSTTSIRISALLITFGLLIKLPTAPFHHWLLQAHTEASTAGSVLLAAILLKIPAFGFFKLFEFINRFDLIIKLVIILAVFSIFYSLVLLQREHNIKRLIAVSSIIHMNIYLLIAVFLQKNPSIFGVYTYFLIIHTFIAGLLFYIVGLLAERLHTKNYKNFSGVLNRLPRLRVLTLLTIFIYGAFPISGVFSLELTAAALLFSTADYVVAGLSLVCFSCVFIKLLSVVNQLCIGRARETAIPDSSLKETLIILTAIFILVILFLINSTVILVLYEQINMLHRYQTHKIKLPIKLRRIFTRRGYRLAFRDPQEPERDWFIGGETKAIKDARLLLFHLNALKFRERVGTFGRDSNRYIGPDLYPKYFDKRSKLTEPIYLEALIGRSRGFKQFEDKLLNINVNVVRGNGGLKHIRSLKKN